MIVSTAPGRCGIVGNPTDIYGGSVISISTRERARCVLAPSNELRITTSVHRAVIADVDDLALRGDTLDIARAALTWFGVDPRSTRFSLDLTTDIPMQAGMAGSTALIVALVGALNRQMNMRLHPWAIAETSRKIENRIMGVVCGHQDQHMAVFGGINYMDFAGKESLEQRDEEPLATVEQLAAYCPVPPLLTANTGVRHHSGTVHSSPRQRWLAGDRQVIDAYSRVAWLAKEGKRALLGGDWAKLGGLMNENHAMVAGLGGSGEANERLIQAARDAGAFGAKLTGAGGGGTILALCDDIERVGAALRKNGAVGLSQPAPMPGLTVSTEYP